MKILILITLLVLNVESIKVWVPVHEVLTHYSRKGKLQSVSHSTKWLHKSRPWLLGASITERSGKEFPEIGKLTEKQIKEYEILAKRFNPKYISREEHEMQMANEAAEAARKAEEEAKRPDLGLILTTKKTKVAEVAKEGKEAAAKPKGKPMKGPAGKKLAENGEYELDFLEEFDDTQLEFAEFEPENLEQFLFESLDFHIDNLNFDTCQAISEY